MVHVEEDENKSQTKDTQIQKQILSLTIAVQWLNKKWQNKAKIKKKKHQQIKWQRQGNKAASEPEETF